MKLAQKLIELAEREVGVEEVNGTNCGPRVNEYKGATNLPPEEAWAWCAAFIDWLVREAMKNGSYTFRRPTTAGAWDLENWSRAQDQSTQTRNAPGDDIRPGDIVIFTFHHVGLAVSAPSGGIVSTIEGNTDSAGSREGGGVYRKQRPLAKIRCRIRFTV